MGRQRSLVEVGLPQVVPQSALSAKASPDQSKAPIQPKRRPARIQRNRWKKPVEEKVNFPLLHEPWNKDDWEKIRKCAENLKENHYLHRHGRGELSGAQSQTGRPTVQSPRHGRPRCRRGPQKSYFTWRKRKVSGVEEDLPLPPVCEHKCAEHEDWDQELNEQAGSSQEDNHSPFSIEDVLTVAMMKLDVGRVKNGQLPFIYHPSVHHMPPVKWEYGRGITVEGQFSDAED